MGGPTSGPPRKILPRHRERIALALSLEPKARAREFHFIAADADCSVERVRDVARRIRQELRP